MTEPQEQSGPRRGPLPCVLDALPQGPVDLAQLEAGMEDDGNRRALAALDRLLARLRPAEARDPPA